MKISVKDFSWHIHEADESEVSLLIQKHQISEIIARLLVNRSIPLERVKTYLNPTIRDTLPDPFHLKDMDKAVAVITKAILAKEKIVIFGDYDVDGATSSALLKRFFNMLNVEVEVYIPDRIGEGYGPTKDAFNKLKNQGFSLIITVDCGTSSFEALEFAKENNLKVVVIDHHLSSENLPPAEAIVNPNRRDETSKYGYLAAVGVAFLTSVALISKLRSEGYFIDKKEPYLLNLLDIVAIGTVCDVVPLEDLNRSFVVQGLKILNKQQNTGIRAFCKLLGIEHELTSYHLGYVIGPRINACGRVGESWIGSKILSTEDEIEASELAKRLEVYNAERRAIEYTVFEQALIQAKEQAKNNFFILVACENWHQGVVGIVAGRLKEIFNKPIAVVSILNDMGKASCRSIPGIDFGSAVVAAKEAGLLTSGGGHKMAAGFTLEMSKLEKVHHFLNERFLDELSKISDKNKRYFDAYVSVEGVHLKLAKEIEKIGPFGPSNPEPKFMLKKVYIVKHNIFGENHISCFVACANDKNNSKLLKLDAFRSLETQIGKIILSHTGPLDVIGHIRINRWKGNEITNFVIEDIIAL